MKTKISLLLIFVAISTAIALVWRRNHAAPKELVLYGNVDIREVNLAFRQPGRLAKMAVDEGSAVSAGTVLAELDAQPLHDALRAATADVQRARAELEKLKQGNRAQEIAQAQEAVNRAEASFRNAENDYQRQLSLLASGATSQRILDTARATRDETAASLAAARQALELQKEGSRKEDIAISEARLASALAAQAQAQTALDDTRLVAPSNGTIISRVQEAGSMVTTQSTVYTLSLNNPTYVRAYVSEPDLGRIAPGMSVTIHTDSSSQSYRGQIGFISPRAEFTPKSVETTELRTDLVYRLRIVVPQADQGLRQGMPITVKFAAVAPVTAQD